MAMTETIAALVGGGLAGLLALAAVLWLAPKPRAVLPRTDVFSEPRRFVFRQGYLIEHSGNVGFLLPAPINNLTAWDDLADALSDLSPDVIAAFTALADTGRPLQMDGQLGSDRITVVGVRDGEDIRVTVASSEGRQESLRMDTASLAALESELALLDRSHSTATALSWVCDIKGRVIWANGAYIALVARCHGAEAARGWPLISLFPDEGGAPAGRSRRKVRDREGTDLWHEVTTLPPDSDENRHMHAISLDAVIAAEDGRRSFIQSLTKTFAVLPTGLALFDAEGRLAQFNPALMDMTGLDPEWLSRRPRLADVFDALRERQQLPEPRDYKAWRDAIAEMGDGPGERRIYRETWTLPGGATYRVTARPQNGAAVTLLLEDVSADASTARALREERSLLADILEQTEEAIVAFDAEGSRLTDNAAARRLWLGDANSDGALPDTLDGCIALWKGACRPSPAWGDLRSFARGEADRIDWSEEIRLETGAPLDMRIAPLPGGRLSISFQVRPDALQSILPAETAGLRAG